MAASGPDSWILMPSPKVLLNPAPLCSEPLPSPVGCGRRRITPSLRATLVLWKYVTRRSFSEPLRMVRPPAMSEVFGPARRAHEFVRPPHNQNALASAHGARCSFLADTFGKRIATAILAPDRPHFFIRVKVSVVRVTAFANTVVSVFGIVTACRRYRNYFDANIRLLFHPGIIV